MTKHSRQRDAVYEELCSRKDHPTAEELYMSLKSRFPAISLATVYRNLSLLADEGKILKLTGENAGRYDGDTSEHCHFTCSECGRLIDIDARLPDFSDCVRSFDGLIVSSVVAFRGICPACKKNSAR